MEGVTEFLPISSTGHLVIVSEFANLDGEEAKIALHAYLIVIQAGAILAVGLIYRKEIWSMVLGFLGMDPRGRRLGFNLILAFLPAALVGPFLDDLIEYANDPEIKVMTAASIDPDEEVTEFGEDGLEHEDEVSEEIEEQKIVSIVLGHVRGRLRYETYQLLLEVLSSCIEEELDEEDGGLDRAFRTMLDNYKKEFGTGE